MEGNESIGGDGSVAVRGRLIIPPDPPEAEDEEPEAGELPWV